MKKRRSSSAQRKFIEITCGKRFRTEKLNKKRVRKLALRLTKNGIINEGYFTTLKLCTAAR